MKSEDHGYLFQLNNKSFYAPSHGFFNSLQKCIKVLEAKNDYFKRYFNFNYSSYPLNLSIFRSQVLRVPFIVQFKKLD